MKTNTTRMLKTMLYVIIMGTTLMFNTSCSSEDGRDGINGAQGEPGAPGQDGNANVQVSDWLPIQFDHVDLPLEVGRMYIEIPNTTEFIEDGGQVMMYLKQQDPNSESFAIVPLSYSTGELYLYYIFGEQTDTYGFEGFTFLANWTGGDVTELENETFSLRYVLIPGNGATNAIDYSKLSHEEIIDHFGLSH